MTRGLNEMKKIITFVVIFLAVSSALPQDGFDFPQLEYVPNADFLHLPAGANFGEVAGVALN